MQFAAPAEHYDRFMGRYAPTLAVALADAAEVRPGMKVLDVGCGPGGLTSELVARVGATNVSAIDPAPQFAAACRERHRGADVREGVAEELPWAAGEFDVVLSSLVIGFMRDPDQGIREMARVARPGGTVAACMWDIAGGGMTMLRIFWSAVRQVKPAAEGERWLAGTFEGDIVERVERAGLQNVVGSALKARGEYVGFDDFWEPFTFAVGRPAIIWPRFPPSSRPLCARRVGRSYPRGPSRSMLGPGVQAGSFPDPRPAAMEAVDRQRRLLISGGIERPPPKAPVIVLSWATTRQRRCVGEGISIPWI